MEELRSPTKLHTLPPPVQEGGACNSSLLGAGLQPLRGRWGRDSQGVTVSSPLPTVSMASTLPALEGDFLPH